MASRSPMRLIEHILGPGTLNWSGINGILHRPVGVFNSKSACYSNAQTPTPGEGAEVHLRANPH